MDLDELKKKILTSINEEALNDPGDEDVADMLSSRTGIQVKDVMSNLNEHIEIKKNETKMVNATQADMLNMDTLDIKRAAHDLKILHQDVMKQNEDLIAALKEKEKTLSELRGVLVSELDKNVREKDISAQTTENLKAQMRDMEKELSEKSAKVAQIEKTLRSREEKSEEIDRLYKELVFAKEEIEIRLRLSDGERKELEEKVMKQSLEIALRDKRLKDEKAQSENALNKLRSEICSLQSLIQDKNDAESCFRNELLRLESEVQARDIKIDADMKYYKRLIRELNLLRNKVKEIRV